MHASGPKPAFYVLLGVLILGLIGFTFYQAQGKPVFRKIDWKAALPATPKEGKAKNPIAGLIASAPKPVEKSSPGLKPVPKGEILLRIHGSNTIGTQLGPALAKAYMESLGATDVVIVPSGKREVHVNGTIDGALKTIEFASHGSATAFTDLVADTADIGMSSRQIEPDEIEALASLGDMTSPASEHELARDGLAVIVNRANKVTTLSTTQLQQIFSGQIKDWDEVGGASGEIAIFARDDLSGTYDTFRAMILKEKRLRATAERFDDSRELSDKVSRTPTGIGFVGLPYVLQTRALALSEPGSRPFFPTRLTIMEEDYPLMRRLYFYTAEVPANEYVLPFIDFALSYGGQAIASRIGFIGEVPPDQAEADLGATPPSAELGVPSGE